MATLQTILDPTLQSPDVRDFEDALRQRVVGQDRAVRRLARVFQVYKSGLNAPGRPIVNLLLLGPTGSGKTRLVEAAAEVLFGDPRAVVKIDCGEMQHSHEIAKLIGSPPGYLGHRETSPLITQEALEQHYTEDTKVSLVLFDEIEKASDALWQLLLGILDKATLTLGDNRGVDFSQSLVFLTSNLGSQEMTRLMSGGLGYNAGPRQDDEELDQKIYHTATEAARRKFSPEFMNRIDKVIVFRTLKRDDSKFGARHLKRSIERHLVFPLSNLLATGQIELGDLVTIDYRSEASQLVFVKENHSGMVGGLAEAAAADRARVSISGAGASASGSFALHASERLAS